MKYELTIRQLEPFTVEEIEKARRDNIYPMSSLQDKYSDNPHHEVRVLQVELSEKEVQEIKKAVIAVM